MTIRLSISEARRRLPSLVHRLHEHPEEVFQISVRKKLVAEIKAPPQVAKKGLAAGHLLALAQRRRKSQKATWKVSGDIDFHLYE